eukprot:XP_014788520.1 PREDICTED: uncharacterized protein LOC106882375 [Octopus bimaculoides]
MKNMKGYAHVNKHSERKRPRVLHRKMSSTISKANNLLGYSNCQYSQLEVPCDAHMNDCSTDVNPVSEDSQSTEESSVSKDRQFTANDTTSQKEWISNMENKNIDFGNILRLTFKRPDKKCSEKVLQADKPKTKCQYEKLSWNVKSNSDVKNNLKNLNKDYITEENISSQKHFDYSALQQPVTTVKGSDFVYGISPIPENVSGRYSFAVPRIAWKSLDKPMHTNLPYQTVSSLDKNCNPVRKMLPQYYNRGVDAAVISAENTREMRQHSTTNTGVFQQNKETNVSSRSQFSDYSAQFTSYSSNPQISSSHLSSSLRRRPLNSGADQDKSSYTSLREPGVSSSAVPAKAGMSWITKLLIMIVLGFMLWMIIMNFEYQPSVPSLTNTN